MYHRVANEVCDPWGLAVSPEKFADQLDWIKQHRTPLSLSDFVELNSQGKLPRDQSPSPSMTGTPAMRHLRRRYRSISAYLRQSSCRLI